MALFAPALSVALLSLTSIATAGARPSVANTQVSGVGEFWLGYAFLSEGTPATVVDDNSYFAMGGDLRLNIPAGGGPDVLD